MPAGDRRAARARQVLASRSVAGDRVSVMLKTEDMAASLDWYQRAGFVLRDRFPDDGEPTWLEVERDDVILQFLAGDTPWPNSPTLTGTIYFYPESGMSSTSRSEARSSRRGGPWSGNGACSRWACRTRTATS